MTPEPLRAARLVPKHPISYERLDEAASAEGWLLEHVVPGGPDDPRYMTWRGGRPGEMHYVEDNLIGLDYVLIHAPDPGSAARRVAALGDAWTPDEVFALARTGGSGDTSLAARLAGILAPQDFDPRFMEVFEAAAAHPNPDVRLDLVTAAGYVRWPEAAALLDRLGHADPDPDVREDAAAMRESVLRQLRRLGVDPGGAEPDPHRGSEL